MVGPGFAGVSSGDNDAPSVAVADRSEDVHVFDWSVPDGKWIETGYQTSRLSPTDRRRRAG